MPHLVQVQRELEPCGLRILAVSEEEPGPVAAAAERLGLGFAVGARTRGREAWRVQAWPTAFLLDPEGRVVWAGNPAADGSWVQRARDLLASGR